jgi:hypothetical protein
MATDSYYLMFVKRAQPCSMMHSLVRLPWMIFPNSFPHQPAFFAYVETANSEGVRSQASDTELPPNEILRGPTLRSSYAPLASSARYPRLLKCKLPSTHASPGKISQTAPPCSHYFSNASELQSYYGLKIWPLGTINPMSNKHLGSGSEMLCRTSDSEVDHAVEEGSL